MMPTICLRRPLAAVLIAALALTMPAAFAQEDSDPRKAFLNADEAGIAFALQGEYAGEIRTDSETMGIGIQVIAQGDGKLDWVAWLGGLPGAGWNGEEPRRGSGEIDGTVGRLLGEDDNGQHARGELKDGSLTIWLADNTRLAELPKVQRRSPTLGAAPPEGAVILFDGTTAETFDGGRMSDDHLLIQGATSRHTFQSAEVHLEFMTSFMPGARGQARANSGCYLQGRYEVQILDSFGLEGQNNECGGIYEISRPALNMCLPPLAWQTYDIEYHAAAYDASGAKTADAWMTVRHNGVVVQDRVKLPRATRAAPVPEGPAPGPLYLQDHGNPIRFRNIWVRPLGD